MMPGQLNVLLVKASIPHKMVFEMDEVKDDFKNMDVTIVVGASDTVSRQVEPIHTFSMYLYQISNWFLEDGTLKKLKVGVGISI